MTRGGIPGSGVVICHQIPEVQIVVHVLDIHHVVVLGPRWTCNCEFEVVPMREGMGISIHVLSTFLEKKDEVLSLLF